MLIRNGPPDHRPAVTLPICSRAWSQVRATDPFSAGEAATLKFIAQGLSNKDKHIFIKLGTEKRAQAVARARAWAYNDAVIGA